MVDEVTLFFDGSTVPNPGRGGAGAVAKDMQAAFYDNITNNRAEYLGLILGLRRLLSEMTVHIVGDSELVINQLNKTYGIYNALVKSLLSRFWHYDLTHEADDLANKGREFKHLDPVLIYYPNLFVTNTANDLMAAQTDQQHLIDAAFLESLPNLGGANYKSVVRGRVSMTVLGTIESPFTILVNGNIKLMVRKMYVVENLPVPLFLNLGADAPWWSSDVNFLPSLAVRQEIPSIHELPEPIDGGLRLFAYGYVEKETGMGGAGAVITDMQGKVLFRELKGLGDNMTHQLATHLAVVMGSRLLQRSGRKTSRLQVLACSVEALQNLNDGVYLKKLSGGQDVLPELTCIMMSLSLWRDIPNVTFHVVPKETLARAEQLAKHSLNQVDGEKLNEATILERHVMFYPNLTAAYLVEIDGKRIYASSDEGTSWLGNDVLIDLSFFLSLPNNGGLIKAGDKVTDPYPKRMIAQGKVNMAILGMIRSLKFKLYDRYEAIVDKVYVVASLPVPFHFHMYPFHQSVGNTCLGVPENYRQHPYWSSQTIFLPIMGLSKVPQGRTETNTIVC
ncbi:hypothetical protein BC829DRAFT_379807 [Chytridium lagenaria]|nr:hypothetical protein BC829DRAFT_379807 [Chytridium lagenaria]